MRLSGVSGGRNRLIFGKQFLLNKAQLRPKLETQHMTRCMDEVSDFGGERVAPWTVQVVAVDTEAEGHRKREPEQYEASIFPLFVGD